jgi:diguanylate cyclase (GGDEF)-like protein/PAS domain S-box-containing protein
VIRLPQTQRLFALRLAILATSYALCAAAVLTLFAADGITSMVWPASGLALAALLIGGTRYWPGIFLGALAGNMLAGSAFLFAFALAIGNTLEALAGVWLLRKSGAFNIGFTRLRDYFLLCWVALASTLVSALVGNTGLLLAGLQNQSTIAHNLLKWWQGDMLGIALVCPLVLVWRKLPSGWLSRERRFEVLGGFFLAWFVGQIVFLGWFADTFGSSVKGIVMFVFVVWSALRCGRHGTLLVIAMVAVQAFVGLHLGREHFDGNAFQDEVTALWLYMLELAVVGMSLALAIGERVQAESVLRLYASVFEHGGEGIMIGDADNNIVAVNPAFTRISGYGLAEVLGKNPRMFAPDAAGAQACDALFADLRTLDHWQGEVAERHKDGHVYPKWMSVSVLRNGEGRIASHITIFSDITERKRTEEEVRLAALVYQTSSEAMMVTDADNTIITVNPAFTEVTGYAPEDIIGKTPRVLSSGRHDRAFFDAMWQAIDRTGKWQGEIWDRHKDGDIYPFWLTINSTNSTDSQALRRVALFYDMTEKKKAEELIWRQANFDALTGLPNRQMFMDRLDQELKKSHRTGLPLALMLLDLDRFKEINDTLGHDMGDRLLKDAASRLTHCVRESDTVARLGGDEFMIILADLDEAGSVERIAQDILHKLATPFYLAGDVAYVTASIGITVFPQDAADADTLIKNADQSMYAAKGQGRNRCSYFTHTMQEAAQTRMRLTNDLRGALAASQLRVYYQPIVELSSGVIRKAEALVRWEHPTRGLIGPVQFIPIAEDTGMINDIGDWVFREASMQAARWRATFHRQFQISVNVSPVQFRSERICHVSWGEHLRGLGIEDDGIVVEITESSLIEDSVTVLDHLNGLREAGIKVSLDDFGTGYSSLSYLKKFDIDYLKIDRSFVQNLSAHPQDMALSEAIIVMAHKLGIKVIAEGVETTEQRDLLAAAGCDYAQGFLYSRPVPAAQFEALLGARIDLLVPEET